MCGRAEGRLALRLAEAGRKGPALQPAEGWAEGSQSISQAILSPLHPGGPLLALHLPVGLRRQN